MFTQSPDTFPSLSHSLTGTGLGESFACACGALMRMKIRSTDGIHVCSADKKALTRDFRRELPNHKSAMMPSLAEACPLLDTAGEQAI